MNKHVNQLCHRAIIGFCCWFMGMPVWGAEPIKQHPSDDFRVEFLPSPEDTFWQSPWLPVGLSFIAPGTGQLYSSNLWGEDKDWFAFIRGIGYVSMLGLGSWQLSNMKTNNLGTNIFWSAILLTTTVASPIDAYLTTTGKQLQSTQSLLQYLAFYEKALQLAEQGKTNDSLELFKQIPPEHWQPIINEREGNILYQEGKYLLQLGRYAEAIEKLQQIKPTTSHFNEAQILINQVKNQ